MAVNEFDITLKMKLIKQLSIVTWCPKSLTVIIILLIILLNDDSGSIVN